MSAWPLLYYPRIELGRFRRIEFFPPRPEDLGSLASICIGSKTRTIGDALMLSTLPGKLKKVYPNLRITTYPRGFNPVIFYGNPAVDGIQYLPRALYGDDNNQGSGHLIQLKEQCFGLPVSEPSRPELHLLPAERAQATALIAQHTRPERASLPLLIIHPWGHTWKRVFSLEDWALLVERWLPRFRVWQIGIEGHDRIEGCDHHFLTPKTFRHARGLFALLENAKAFIGVNSGPMHVAKAFGVSSLVLTEQGDLSEIFRQRRELPYFLKRNWAHSFLYEDNAHVDVPQLGTTRALAEMDHFLKSQAGQLSVP